MSILTFYRKISKMTARNPAFHVHLVNSCDNLLIELHRNTIYKQCQIRLRLLHRRGVHNHGSILLHHVADDFCPSSCIKYACPDKEGDSLVCDVGQSEIEGWAECCMLRMLDIEEFIDGWALGWLDGCDAQLGLDVGVSIWQKGVDIISWLNTNKIELKSNQRSKHTLWLETKKGQTI